MSNDSSYPGAVSNRRSFIKGAGAATVVALAGCTDDAGGNGGGTDGGSGTSGGAVTDSLEWENGKSIHFLGPTSESTWWRAMPAGHLIEAQKRDWKLSFSFPGWDPAAMNDAIRSRAQNHDALVLNPAAFEAHTQAIDQAWNQYNTPVAGNNDGVGAGVTHNIQSANAPMGELMATRALEWLDENRGGREGKTVAHFQGDPNVTGWRLRAEGVQSVMEKNSEVNYVEIASGSGVSSWSEAAQTYFSSNSADAILTDSDGAFSQVIINALSANDMLYHNGHDKHIFLAGIDGYPSSSMYVRKGLQTITVPQTPFAITQNISKMFYEHILNDPSIQQSGAERPKVPTDATAKAPTDPVEMYWGESEGSITMEMSDYDVPIGTTPPKPYVISRDNVNEHNHWSNVWPAWKGRTDLMDVEFNAQSDKPDYVDELVSEFNNNLKSGKYGERLDYLDRI